MSDVDDVDLRLFGSWPGRIAYEDRDEPAGSLGERRLQREAGRLVLEMKSAATPEDELRLLLNDMTREMRDQFDYFRKLRAAADLLSAGDGIDDAAAKLARADVKAATDAMSLIVRTLEKIDSLQRQLARDRELEAESPEETPDYQDARNKILEQIERRADEKARRLYESWVAGAGPPAIDDAAAGQAATGAGEPSRTSPGKDAGSEGDHDR